MKTVNETVNYLVRHYQEKAGEVTENLLPAKIDDLLNQMGHFLEVRLKEETPYKDIWDAFVKQPEDNQASLSGILSTLFEAQPAVRERVDGFMQKITAIEVKQSEDNFVELKIENELRERPGEVISASEGEANIPPNKRLDKNQPAYLYDNERANFESEVQKPTAEPFMVGENAQIIYIPTSHIGFPKLFEHFAEMVDTSETLSVTGKQRIQEHLETIQRQLTAREAYDEQQLAQAIEAIWDEDSSYANALIRSLQNDLDALPLESRSFIVQLHTNLK